MTGPYNRCDPLPGKFMVICLSQGQDLEKPCLATSSAFETRKDAEHYKGSIHEGYQPVVVQIPDPHASELVLRFPSEEMKQAFSSWFYRAEQDFWEWTQANKLGIPPINQREDEIIFSADEELGD